VGDATREWPALDQGVTLSFPALKSARILKTYFVHGTHLLLAAGEEILVGGQAVFEGVMMRSPRTYSVAVRCPDKSVAIKKDFLTKPSDRNKVWGYPVLRGMATLGQALVLGMRALKFSTDQALQEIIAEAPSADVAPPVEKKELGNWFITLNILIALVFFLLLFKFVPLFLASQLRDHFPLFANQLLFSIVDGVIRLLIFVGYILAISRLKDIRRVFQYHGAEHKVVFTFEAGEPLSVENARKFSTLHPRCGTSFLMVVMLVSIVVYAFIPFQGFALKFLSRIVLLPLIAGVSYEVIRYAAKRQNSILQLMTRPGLWMQKVTTREPSDDQLEIAIRALDEALLLERQEGAVAVL
jgi:uncharacterized protein YqhQ